MFTTDQLILEFLLSKISPNGELKKIDLNELSIIKYVINNNDFTIYYYLHGEKCFLTFNFLDYITFIFNKNQPK